MEMSKKFLLALLLIVTTLFLDATELRRDGWNLISVCQDMNRTEIDMAGIEEIQSQDGKSIYTGEWESYSNLDRLQAGYGYWVKGTTGIIFDSGESRSILEQPLLRDGWNLMASCEDIPSLDINLTEWNITEIQSQDGKSIYSGDWADYSNLDSLENGYGYWVKGDTGTPWVSKRGVSIPTGFDYQTINNSGEIIETNFEDLTIRLFVDYNETADAQANHTGIVVRINGQDAPLMQIQDTYRGHNIVVGIYNMDGELIGVSDVVVVATEGAGTFIDVELEDIVPPEDIHPSIWLMGEGLYIEQNQTSRWWFETEDVDSVRLAEGTPSFVRLIEHANDVPMSEQRTLQQSNIPRAIQERVSTNSGSYSTYILEINTTGVNIPTGYYPIEVIGVNNDLGIEVNGTLNLFYGIAVPNIDFEQQEVDLNQGESRSINFNLYNADSVEIGETFVWNGYRQSVSNFSTINGNSIEITPPLDSTLGRHWIELLVRDSSTGGERSQWIYANINPEGSNHRPDINLTIIHDRFNMNETNRGLVIATINATDIDGDDINYSLEYAPSFIVLDGNNVVYQPDGTETPNWYDINLFAEDSNGARSYIGFGFELIEEESNRPVVGLQPLYTTDSRLNYEIYGETDSNLLVNSIDTGYQLTNGSTMIDFARNSGEVISLKLDIDGEISEETNLTLVEYPSLNLSLSDKWSSKVVSLHRNNSQPASSNSNKPKLLQSNDSSSYYAKYFYFTVESGQNITIDLTSSTDTYLVLLDGFGKESSVIASNDDYNSTLNSHIEIYLGAGTYTIEATTFGANRYGEFNLNLRGEGTDGGGGNHIPFTEDKISDRTFYMERWYDEAYKQVRVSSTQFNADYSSMVHWYHAPLDATSWTQDWESTESWHIDDNGSLVTKEEHNITVHTWSNEDTNGSWYRCDLTEKYNLLNEYDDRYEINASHSIYNCTEIDDPTINSSRAVLNINLSDNSKNRVEKTNIPFNVTETSDANEPFSCMCDWITTMYFNQPQPFTKDELREQGYDDVTVNGTVEFRDDNGSLATPQNATVHIAHEYDNWHPALGFNALIDGSDFNQTEFVRTYQYSAGQMMEYQVYIDDNHNELFDEGEEMLCSQRVLFEDIGNFVCNTTDGGEEPPVITQRELPLIIIRINFNDYQFRNNESVWHSKIFGNHEGELNHYYNEISYGNFQFKEANETDGTVNDGIITVSLNENHPGDVDSFIDRINSAVSLANSYIDFSAYDKNHNGAISKDELQIMYLVAGGESATGVTPGIWAHAWCMYGGNAEAPTHDGVKIMNCGDNGGYSRFGERHFGIDGPDASMGIIAHELGHAALSLPDLYDYDGSSEGIGDFGLMGGGSWGKKPGDNYPGETPVHMTGWSKIKSGFAVPEVINSDVTNLNIRGASYSDYKFYKIYTGVADEYFLIENRAPSGYDMGLTSLAGTDSFTGGLSILHIDDTRQNNSDDAHRVVDIEEANNAGLDSKADRGHINNLFFSGNSDSFTPTSTPNSNTNDGANTGISVTNISDAGSTMSVDIDVN
jgi:M6 family metalloprotease-like protein